MTATYKTGGSLTEDVNDFRAAVQWLHERQEETPMAQFIWPDDARDGVHSVTWHLLDEATWEVTLVADRELTPAHLGLLSQWISGQNSDGLGEGFEQQPFAEHEDEEDEDEVVYHMSSFDWETNPCELRLVRGE